MPRQLFDIWEDIDDIGPLPWRAKLVNYIGQFTSRAKAESFIEATKKARTQDVKSAVKKSK